MKNKKTSRVYEQLDMFGASSNEHYFTSEMWGLLTFYATKKRGWDAQCRHCLLYRSTDCDKAKCTTEERMDGMNGYYSIHEMPTTKSKRRPR